MVADGWRGGTWRQSLGAILAWLVGPTLALAVYPVATASPAPRVSMWGLYQRLQGAYSTLSYMVIALLMMQTMRWPSSCGAW